jgi:O-methyltransferase
MKKKLFKKVRGFENIKLEPTIINDDQLDYLVLYLLDCIDNNIDGDVVELGCFVGESSKYLRKSIEQSESSKKLYVYDSFEGLPELTKYEEGTGWREGTLNTTEDILTKNFVQNGLELPIITKSWFKDIPNERLPEKISFAFLDGDFYNSIYDSLTKIYDRVENGGYICFHDYDRNDLPGVKAAIVDFFSERSINYEILKVCDQLAIIKKNEKIVSLSIEKYDRANIESEESLDYYIKKYGTDKSISGYTPMYECIFDDLRSERLALLEIGIGSLDNHVIGNFIQTKSIYYDHYVQGGSLRVWRDYFPKAEIHGIDIADDCKFSEDRISTFICDSRDKSECDSYLKENTYDIIIDDGLHKASAQLQTLKNFFDRVKKNGYYIIEDLGGGGDGTNLYADRKQDVIDIIKDHEWFFKNNFLAIKKTNSKRGELSSLTEFKKENNRPKSDLTIVSGLWDIGKQNRSFDHYLMCFEKFLEIDQNLFLFIPKELEDLVWTKRSKHNTRIKIVELEDVKNLYGPFWDRTQEIRKSEDWINQANWLANSPQGSLEWYNPIVMSKLAILHDASIYNPFRTENFIWLDAGISNTINYNLLIESDFFDKLPSYLDPFLFIQYPYPYYNKGIGEVHGFNWEKLNEYAGGVVEWISRGGLFGGKKEVISDVNSYYWHLLDNSLNENLMGTEESLFSILAKKYPEIFRTSKININGHIQEFVEAVINNTAVLDPIPEDRIKSKHKFVNVDNLKVSLYMLTFNFPHQVEHTIQKWLKHEKWITNTRNILIDNSTNDEARIANAEICKKYNFEHIITNENTGINGGRFRAAQHFQESDSDYYIFLEDDMGINSPSDTTFCRNGFRRHIPNLYDRVLKIIHDTDIDFLKLSYTEVYMDNNIQVSWYNVPQNIRSEFWPDYDKLPVQGLDPNCPRTKFNEIEVLDGLSYATGEIYYCNWPTICGKKGNQKMFLDVTWQSPFEQTWMSYMYQETKKGNLKPAVLLASPIDHDRIAHYKPEERREN